MFASRKQNQTKQNVVNCQLLQLFRKFICYIKPNALSLVNVTGKDLHTNSVNDYGKIESLVLYHKAKLQFKIM